MKKILITTLSALLAVLLLTSCSVIDKLGFDTYDYMSEEVIETHGTIGELSDTLQALVSVLITDSPVLETFSDTNGAIKCYSDETLTYMLKNGYSKYTGNTSLIEKAQKEYPQYIITQIIPDEEFEAMMYQTFGGSVKIVNKSVGSFEYLDKVSAYISPIFPEDSGYYPRITYIGETNRTYKIRFCVALDGEDVSDEYFALVIKRDDGTLYFKKLLPASAIK